MPEFTQNLLNNDVTNVGSVQLYEEAAKRYGLTALIVSGGGAGAVQITGDATSGLDVDVNRIRPDGANVMPALDTVARSGFMRITDGVEIIDVSVQGAAMAAGDAAHDDADVGRPLKIGGKARTAHPAAVANLDRADGYFDKLGRLVTRDYVPRELIASNAITLTASVAETTLLAAGGAGIFHDLALLIISNSSATDARIDIRDATGGAVKLQVFVKAQSTEVVSFPIPQPQAAGNQNWTAQSSASVSSIHIFAQAVKDA